MGFDNTAERERFYREMQPYFDEGIIRVICSGDHYCIFALGEVAYVAGYFLYEDDPEAKDCPKGFFLNHKVALKIVNDPKYIYLIIASLFEEADKNHKALFFFPEEKLPVWKNWIAANKARGKTNIDPKFEKRLIEAANNPSGSSKLSFWDEIRYRRKK